MENIRQVFNTPPTIDAIEIKRMYGKVIRSNVTVNANFSGLSVNPGAVIIITALAKITPRIVNISNTNPNNPATDATKSRVSSGVRWFLYSASTGTNACENAPSAKIRRSKFGNLEATKNASVAIPAPNIWAITISRKKPTIREINVMPLTPANDFSKLPDLSMCALLTPGSAFRSGESFD